MMERTSSGFSLIEVVLSLGIIVFSLVALLGVFPVGLKQSGSSIHETRSTQLAHAVFATLKGPPQQATTTGTAGWNVNCYGASIALDTEDFAEATRSRDNAQVTLYADFPVSGSPVITADGRTAATAAYRIGLWFHKIPDSTVVVNPPSVASEVTLIVYPWDRSSPGIEFQSIVGNY